MFSKFFPPKKDPPKQENKEEWTKRQIRIALNIKFKGKVCECCGVKDWVLSPEVMEHNLFYILIRKTSSSLAVRM